MELKDKLAIIGAIVSAVAVIPPLVGVFNKPSSPSPASAPIHIHGDGAAINTGSGSITQNTNIDRSISFSYVQLWKDGIRAVWSAAVNDAEPDQAPESNEPEASPQDRRHSSSAAPAEPLASPSFEGSRRENPSPNAKNSAAPQLDIHSHDEPEPQSHTRAHNVIESGVDSVKKPHNNSAHASELDEAQRVAVIFLDKIGSSQFDLAWEDDISQSFKKTITKEAFFANISSIRIQTGGKGADRKLIRRSTANLPPDAEISGRIFSFTFSSTYPATKIYESVVLIKEKGKFKIIGFNYVPNPN